MGTIGKQSSDSSMDDCNKFSREVMFIFKVSSDSSMDDCNERESRIDEFLKLCSDSSMDDCNGVAAADRDTDTGVQIPLWTIVTVLLQGEADRFTSSDSSMDDCNVEPAAEKNALCRGFRFLYGRL